MNPTNNPVKLTRFSHGAGCGCKISPDVLKKILSAQKNDAVYPNLIVGNSTNDDAAVYQIDDKNLIISTTDFFMPIVDDPFDFGAIASVNSISDIYAMGGSPIMAIAILGWPISKIDPAVAGDVLSGARRICDQAAIPLAGGHSIDAPEPIFGLAVTGTVLKKHLKTNSGATANCDIYLTKSLGVGVMTTAQKRSLLDNSDFEEIKTSMLTLNELGPKLGKLSSVKAMTDVTGFGLLGHLIEMCEASNLSAEIKFNDVAIFSNLKKYINLKTIPGGTERNFKSYNHTVSPLTEEQRCILCDPQTSGGLLIAVEKNSKEFRSLLDNEGLNYKPIGSFTERNSSTVKVS